MRKSGFDAYDLALEIKGELKPLLEIIRRYDPDAAEEALTAAASVCNNLSEGRKRSGRDRTHFFRLASGSNGEIRSVLDQAEVDGILTAAQTDAVQAKCDREAAMLWRLSGH